MMRYLLSLLIILSFTTLTQAQTYKDDKLKVEGFAVNSLGDSDREVLILFRTAWQERNYIRYWLYCKNDGKKTTCDGPHYKNITKAVMETFPGYVIIGDIQFLDAEYYSATQVIITLGKPKSDDVSIPAKDNKDWRNKYDE